MERPAPQSIPDCPGVYLYRDKAGEVIYVGKARILRRRVLSYFRNDIPPKTVAMLAHACTLEYLTTTTDKEAFLLEASLIKKYRPHYNILLRDDKQYALFRLDVKADYPRLEIVRHARRDQARYFGPFTSALAARQTWKLLHQAFPLRRCTDRAMRNRVRPCLYHHMGQCLAPCMGTVSREDYHSHVTHICQVLSGKADDFLAELKERMFRASEELEFEQAAMYRDQIQAVERTVEQQAVVLPRGGDMDVIGLYAADEGLALGILFVRSGAVMDARSFFWQGLDFDDAAELLTSFVGQFYLDAMPPGRILLPWIPEEKEEPEAEDDAALQREAAEKAACKSEGKAERRPEGREEGRTEDRAAAPASDQAPEPAPGESAAAATCAAPGRAQAARGSFTVREVLEQTLAERRGAAVRLVAPQNAADNRLVDIAQSNAREECLRRKRAAENSPLNGIARLLHLAKAPSRIECVDVSHTQGRQTRVGMVVYTDGQADRPAWRTYTMPDSNDDYQTLHAWIARRLESGPPWPDLLLVDGGRGQIAAVMRALTEAGQATLFAVAGIAKARDEEGHADRRAGNVADRIFLPGRSNPLPFREGSPELLFLQSVRDSTHHFAITSHRKARSREALSSELMRLPGIGTATARMLWDHYGSLSAMARASEAELATLPGIGRARAKKIAACLADLAGEGSKS